MNILEKELKLLDKKAEYLKDLWEQLHHKFFEENKDLDPEYISEGISNSGLSCWLFKYAIEHGSFVDNDFWFILDVVQKAMKKEAY